MKVLFTADLHIKVGQKNVPKEWQKSRYRMLFSELSKLKKDCDLVVLGGDIFDKVPNIEELELYFELVNALKGVEVVIYDGNHEATRKGETFLWHLAQATQLINPDADILNGVTSIYGMDFIPYTELKSFNPKDFSNKVLFTHVRGEIKPHVKPEIPLDKLNRWDIVLAGDLHSHTNTQRNIVYPGSPVTTSFHRNRVETGVIIFDSNDLTWEFKVLNLPQLIRKTVQSEEDIVPTEFDHTIYEVVGDISELSDIDNSLVDKKLVTKNTEVTLNLSNLSILEEIGVYLKKVFGLEDRKIKEILGIYNDYIKESDLE